MQFLKYVKSSGMRPSHKMRPHCCFFPLYVSYLAIPSQEWGTIITENDILWQIILSALDADYSKTQNYILFTVYAQKWNHKN
jgi:hypothetical protein